MASLLGEYRESIEIRFLDSCRIGRPDGEFFYSCHSSQSYHGGSLASIFKLGSKKWLAYSELCFIVPQPSIGWLTSRNLGQSFP